MSQARCSFSGKFLHDRGNLKAHMGSHAVNIKCSKDEGTTFFYLMVNHDRPEAQELEAVTQKTSHPLQALLFFEKRVRVGAWSLGETEFQ